MIEFKVRETTYNMENFDKFLAEYGLMQKEFAHLIGVSTSVLQEYIKHNIPLREHMKIKIEIAEKFLRSVKKETLEIIRTKIVEVSK